MDKRVTKLVLKFKITSEEAMALIEEGLDTPAKIRETDIEYLAEIVGDEVARGLRSKVR